MILKRSLARILRLRSLLEDVSRTELEVRARELKRIEQACKRSEETGRAMRQRIFSNPAERQNGDWLEAQALTEWTAWETSLLEKVRQKKMVELDTARTAYRERRKESGQVRTVMEARMSVASIEQGRREQRELDDWFGLRKRHDAANGSA